MEKFIIATDSSCDMPSTLAEELGVLVVSLTLTVEDKSYTNYLDGREIGFKEFYDCTRQKKDIHTSCPSIGAFISAMTPYLEDGNDILYIGFSSALSATTQNAKNAAEELKEKFPERKIIVVDSLSASLGQGMLVYLTCKEKEKGKSLEETAKFVEDTKLHLCHWFTVDDLMYLKNGGRINAATAIFGTAMNIKPVMHMDNEGRLINVGKAIGRGASLTELLNKMKKTAIHPEEQTIFISHGDCEEEVKTFAQKIKDVVGFKDVIINYVGPVIGAHTGQNVVALFFVGTER